jgi:hypothetical protein
VLNQFLDRHRRPPFVVEGTTGTARQTVRSRPPISCVAPVFFRTLRGSGERAWVGAAESWYGSVAPSPFQPVRLDQIVPALNEQPRKVRKNLPQALVQTCIVHLLRGSLEFVSWKDRKAVAVALKDISRAIDAEAACGALSGGRVGSRSGI